MKGLLRRVLVVGVGSRLGFLLVVLLMILILVPQLF